MNNNKKNKKTTQSDFAQPAPGSATAARVIGNNPPGQVFTGDIFPNQVWVNGRLVSGGGSATVRVTGKHIGNNFSNQKFM